MFKTDKYYFLCLAFCVKKKILVCSGMIEASMWLSAKEASKVLRVDEKSLELLRERGYLKPGSHWRSSNDPKQLPWKPKVFYFISGCKEVVENLENNDDSCAKRAA